MDTERGRDTSPSSPEPLVEEIVPNWAWTEDHEHHVLLVDLPEFIKEEVQLQVDASTGRIIVKGERQIDENNCVHFELTFPLPADSDMDNISGNFESEILHVYVPKRSSQEHRESDEIENVSNGNVERPQEIESDHEEHNLVNEERDHSPHDRGREKEEIKSENSENIDGVSDGLITRKLVQEHNVQEL